MTAISNSCLYLTQTGLNVFIALIFIPIVTNKLLPSEYGVFALAQVYAFNAVGMPGLGRETVSAIDRNIRIMSGRMILSTKG